MKDKFTSYLESLDASNVVVERANHIYDLFTNLLDVDLSGIFLNDFINQDGNMQFDTLWFFSDKYIIQAVNFLQSENFEIFSLKMLIASINIQKQEYDFESASKKSRLNITINLTNSGPYSFKASKTNCDYLKGVFIEYLRPNLLDFSEQNISDET